MDPTEENDVNSNSVWTSKRQLLKYGLVAMLVAAFAAVAAIVFDDPFSALGVWMNLFSVMVFVAFFYLVLDTLRLARHHGGADGRSRKWEFARDAMVFLMLFAPPGPPIYFLMVVRDSTEPTTAGLLISYFVGLLVLGSFAAYFHLVARIAAAGR